MNPAEFTRNSLIDGLHAAIAIYQEEAVIEPVRQFIQKTELLSNDHFMKAWEVALKVIPDVCLEKQVLLDLRLAIDEIKAKVVYVQTEMAIGGKWADGFISIGISP